MHIATLQYLDWPDFQKYMKSLGESRDHLLHDADYVQTFHREHLSQHRGDPKKLAGYVRPLLDCWAENLLSRPYLVCRYKQRVLCYLLSHANSCPLLNVKFALLNSLAMVTNEAKAPMLLPTIETLFGMQDVSVERFQSLATLTVSAFDESSAAELNVAEKPTWNAYEKLLVISLTDGMPHCIRLSSTTNQ